MKAVTLTNNNNKRRRELDFYPTPPEVTHALMKFITLPNHSVIWEPACGEGAMVDVLSQYGDSVKDGHFVYDSYGSRGHRVIASDIRETNICHKPIDFLSTSLPDIDAIITNPPFNLSEAFIRHALSQSPVVAMLLKSQYWHATKRIKLFDEFTPSYVLALSWRPDFLFDTRKPGDKKAAPTMEVVWTVWIEGDTDTKYRILKKPTGCKNG
jgi:hypothetical protein